MTLKNSNRATGGRALESTRNVIIANGKHLNDYIEIRDKLLMLED